MAMQSPPPITDASTVVVTGDRFLLPGDKTLLAEYDTLDGEPIVRQPTMRFDPQERAYFPSWDIITSRATGKRWLE